jgi:hypothetical protein
MAEEKEKAPEAAIPAGSAEEAPTEGTGQVAMQSEEAAPAPRRNHKAEKRGRLVMAGLIATATVSIIALGVAGVVQLTSRWLTVCPTDLPVNDPAPILWKTVTADQIKAQPLGVPERIAGEARFKQQ